MGETVYALLVLIRVWDESRTSLRFEQSMAALYMKASRTGAVCRMGSEGGLR
jgi:hypothetical protein